MSLPWQWIGVVVILLSACAGVKEQTLMPVMGYAGDDRVGEEQAGEPFAALKKAVTVPDSTLLLAQAMLILPFRDMSKYKGPWNIYAEVPMALEDTLSGNEFFRIIPLEAVLNYLTSNELQGQIGRDRALEIGRVTGADYVILGEIKELTVKRFRATVPIGGYRTYEGVASIVLQPIKVIDGQPEEEIVVAGLQDNKLSGITNPAAYVPFDREYYQLGEIPWGTDEFRSTLVGQAVGQALQQAVVSLSKNINPPPEFTVSKPKIIDIVGPQAYINVGSANGVENGDKFGVWDKGRELRDPQTNTYLGHALPRRVGVLQVEQILNEHLSIVRILDGQEAVERDFEVRAE